MASVSHLGMTSAGAFAILGADRAEDRGAGGSLVFGSARTRAAPGPTPGDLVLLADAGLVCEPDLYGGRIDAFLAPDLVQARRETFLKSSIARFGLGVVTSRKLAITHGAQLAAQRLLGDNDAEFLENPLAEIDDPPAHDPMNGWNRAALDDRSERRPMRVVQPGRLSGPLAVDQPFRSAGVELHHPVANDLQRHPADLRRLRACRAVVNRRQPQNPPPLRPILRSLGRGPHHLRVKIAPKRNGHGEPPLFATLESDQRRFGNPRPSHTFGDLVLMVPVGVAMSAKATLRGRPSAQRAGGIPIARLQLAGIALKPETP